MQKFPFSWRHIAVGVAAAIATAAPLIVLGSTAGPQFASTGANDTSIGTRSWSNTSSVTADDNNYASSQTLSNGNPLSNYLRASGFDFSAIPNTATIDGITVTIGRKGSSATLKDNEVRLAYSTGTTTSKGDTSTVWTTSETAASYGGVADTWGRTWTPAEIKSSDFKVLFSAQWATGGSAQAQVDYIKIAVAYTDADTTPPPTPTIDSTPTNPTNSTSFAFTFSDTEGGVTFLCRVDSDPFSACTSPFSGSTIAGARQFDVKAKDATGNESAAASYSWTIDTTNPTGILSSSASNPTNVSPIPFTITWSEAVSGFDLADINVGNGTASNLAGGPTIYTFDVTPAAEGSVAVDINGDKVQDAAGNNNIAVAQVQRIYAASAPSVSITAPAADGSSFNTASPSIAFTTAPSPTSNETITAVDCSLDGGAFAACTTGTSYDASGLSEGTHTLAVRATDNASNTATAARQFFVDLTSPGVVLSSASSGTVNGAFSVTATFSENVTNFDLSDITVGNGTASNLAGGPTIYTFDVTPAANGAVTVAVGAGAATDSAANPNTASNEFSVTYLALTTSASTVTVAPADLETETNVAAAALNNSGKWFFYNDETDAIDNSLGSLVSGPATAPAGTGSAQMSVTGSQRRNLATYRFKDVPLANIKTLSYATYSQSAGNGSPASERAAYLNFNVDFDNSDTWQRRLSFVPANNGTVVNDTWQTWDAIGGGNALWTYSGATWPAPLTGSGSTPKTWSQILAAFPNAQTRSTDSWFGFRVGEPYADGFTGNVDKFVIGIQTGANTDTTTFDFEPTIIPAPACDSNSSFDSFSLGSVNGQGGWSITGGYDQAVVTNNYGYSSLGCQTLRISDAVTSGAFGDQLFSPSTANEAGETAATNNGFSGGTRQNHFEAEFILASAVPGAMQNGMHLSVSPDRGDGARMSYLRFEDQSDGIRVYFDDVTDAGPLGTGASFNESQIGVLDRSTAHTIKFSMDFVDGPANDVVKIYIDGTLVHTGTSWEDYYRYDPEQAGGGNQVPTVDSLLFRESGDADSGNAGKGFLIDGLSLVSQTPTVTTTTTTTTGGGGGGGQPVGSGPSAPGSNNAVIPTVPSGGSTGGTSSTQPQGEVLGEQTEATPPTGGTSGSGSTGGSVGGSTGGTVAGEISLATSTAAATSTGLTNAQVAAAENTGTTLPWWVWLLLALIVAGGLGWQTWEYFSKPKA